MKDERTVLLGMNNNQLGSDPKYALYPLPRGSAGSRLFAMLRDAAADAGRSQPTMREYVDAFDRRNLLAREAWSQTDARRAGGDALAALAGRRVVVLGAATLDALRLPRGAWGAWLVLDRPADLMTGASSPITYAALPHPSGRCREYNDYATRAAAGALLLGEYERWRSET